MNDKKILSWQIEKFLKNPILSAILLVIMVGILFSQNTKSGVIATVFVVIYIGILVTYYIKLKPKIMAELTCTICRPAWASSKTIIKGFIIALYSNRLRGRNFMV